MITEQARSAALARLAADGAASSVIAAFADRFDRWARGETGYLREAELTPLLNPPELSELPLDEAAVAALAQTAVVRLNGGLGTSMGLSGPKCLIPVRDGLSFLDIVVRQILALRAQHGVQLPLLFMNSYHTSAATLAAAGRYQQLPVSGLPLEFRQSREPKLLADSGYPVDWPADPELAWCPPGHGDFYPSLQASGLIAQLRAAGIRYLFVANMDNLGARPDPRLAGWFAASAAPYAAEVTERTDMDRKGGHLAHRSSDGRLVLRDTAQVAPDEMVHFLDNLRHPWAHCNNLWLDLAQLEPVLAANQGTLRLPLIINRKTVDPTDSTSPAVVQLESAIGAAVEVFAGALAVAVPRSRFLPVKSTEDLLLLRSDVYQFTADAQLLARGPAPTIRLDPLHYRLLADFEARFPAGPPSLIEANSLTVQGDFTFGAGVVARGEAVVRSSRPQRVPDGWLITSISDMR